ncbi:MAG: hypothetical protein IJ700_00235 [Bacteroidaceae bacterium]|nr:hypothetical protein [Bacteroidaceae bacterium]
MKKIVLTLAAAFALTAVQAQDKPITETTVALFEGTTTVTHNLYNVQGYLLYSLTEGVEEHIYTLNDLGQAVQEEYNNFANPNSSRTYLYTYNALGQRVSVEELAGERSLGTTTYTYDDHGNVATQTPSALPVPITYLNTYDSDGNLTSVSLNFMGRDMGTTLYTYANGVLIKSESSAGIFIYTYDADGRLATRSLVDEVETELEVTTYAYPALTAYAPYNLVAVANPGNTVTLTWEGEANSVIVDGQYVKVTGNSYTTPVLLDGIYTIYVANDGYAVVSEPVEVLDDTKVGVSNVKLNGEITYTREYTVNADDEPVVDVTYNIPVSWELPAGAQPQSYIIYYNQMYSVTVEDGSLREYVIPATSVTAWSMAAGEYTLPFEIRIIAVYATGQVEPANVITFTQEESDRIIADNVKDIRSQSAAATEVYTLDGLRLNAVPRKGTYLLRQGNSVRKIQVK